MKRIIVDAAALDAVVRDVEHNCFMLALADEESAADDVEFYVPEIQRAADRLRGLIREAEQARVTIDAPAVVERLDAVLLACVELDRLTAADSMEDVWYYAEQIKQGLTAIRGMIDAEGVHDE